MKLELLVSGPMAARRKAWACGRCLPGIVGSNTARGKNVVR